MVKPMNKTILLGILFVGIAVLMMFPVMNAMAVITGTGEVTFINKPGTHGKIVRTDDSSNDVYQFQIPQGLADPNNAPALTDCVTFDVDPPQAKVARNVAKCAPQLTGTLDAAPNPINAGSSTNLSYTTTGAVSASIDGGVGSVTLPSGSVSSGVLQVTTLFTLTICNDTGCVTDQVTVVVE